MEEGLRPSHLLDYELNYELKIRSIETERNVQEKRKMLSTLLYKEKQSNKSLISNKAVLELEFDEEEVDINKSMKSITDIIADFEGTVGDSVYLRMKSRLFHLSKRIKRVPVPEDNHEAQKYLNESYASCLTLESDLFDKVREVEPNQNFNPVQQQPIIHVSPPVVSCNSNVPAIGDWQVKFNGDGKKLYHFLERISELAQSRRVRDEDLFNSAAELFIGDAFVWYKSIKSSVNDWQSLVVRLKKDFLHSDVEDDLWDQIKSRKQKSNESVAVFIAHLQVLFSRLTTSPAEVTRIKHIKNNLLPEYITQLALMEVRSVNDLATYCRKIEEASYIKNKRNQHHSVNELKEPEHNKPSTSHYNNNNNFNKYNSSQRYNSNRPQNKFNNKTFSNSRNINSHYENKQSNSSNNSREFKPESKNKVVCWNCELPNHVYMNCTSKRNIFCFKCGFKGIKTNECPKCSKNE